MSAITSLPVEVLEKILTDKKLSVEDVVNFSSTNRYFRYLVNTNRSIWKRKFLNKWPELGKFLNNNDDYHQEFISLYEIRNTFQMWLLAMPAKFFHRHEIVDSELSEWNWVFEQRPHIYQYLVIYLMNIINTHAAIESIEEVDLRVPGNLTLQYYAKKVLRFVRQAHLTLVLENYYELSYHDQLLEQAAVMVAQWFQPFENITHEDISNRLDNVAELVKDHLLSTHPTHPIAHTTQEQLSTWSQYNLTENQWNFDECCQVFASVNYVLYQSLEFHGKPLHCCVFEDLLINKVLDNAKGLVLVNSIIYESVARRLGVKCDALNTDGRVTLQFLYYKVKYQVPEVYFVDVYDNGKLVRSCVVDYPSDWILQKTLRVIMPVASRQQITENLAYSMEKIIRNNNSVELEPSKRAVHELLTVLNPWDDEHVYVVAGIFLYGGVDSATVSTYLTEGPNQVTPENAEKYICRVCTPKVVKRESSLWIRSNNPSLDGRYEMTHRTDELKYAIGMIMVHNRLHFKCVIVNWDLACLVSSRWDSKIGLTNLKYGRQQPFYNILLKDGTETYVAQEQLTPVEDLSGPEEFLGIGHLGKYFSHSFHNHFVPNHQKAMEYPTDKEVRFKFYHEAKLKSMQIK